MLFHCCLRFDHPALCCNNDISADRVPWWNRDGNNPLHLFYVREEGVEILFCVGARPAHSHDQVQRLPRRRCKKNKRHDQARGRYCWWFRRYGAVPTTAAPTARYNRHIPDIYLVYIRVKYICPIYTRHIPDIYLSHMVYVWYMSNI